MGVTNYEQNNFKEAENLVQEAIDLVKKQKGEENQEIVNYYFFIAGIYEDTCLYSKALEVYLKCQNIVLKLPEEKEKGIELAKVKGKIGNLYSLLNDYVKANCFLNESLCLIKESNGENSLETAKININLGTMYIESANFKKAHECLIIAEAIYSRDNSSNNLGLADVLNCYGDLYYSTNEFKKSLDHYKKALEIKKNILGENHLDVALIYNNLALVFTYYDDNMPKNALAYFEKALEIRLMLNKRYAAITYNDIGYFYYLAGNFEMASHYYKESSKINNSIWPHNHKEIALGFKNVALIEDKRKEYESALKIMDKVILIYTSIFGETHVNVSNSYFEVGVIVSHSPKHQDKTENYYSKALEIRKKIFNDNPHPDTSDIYCYIGLFYSQKANYEKALENHKKCLNIRTSIFGEERCDIVAIALRNVAITQLQLEKENDECEKMLLKALDIKRRIYGENHIETANIYQDIGYYYEKIDNLKKGERFYKDALKLYNKLGIYDKSNTVLTKLSIIQIKMEKHKKAIKYLEKSLLNQS